MNTPNTQDTPLPPGLDRRQVLDMAMQAGFRTTNPGMAPEVLAFAALITAANRQFFADLIAPAWPLHESDQGWLELEAARNKIMEA